MSFALLYTPSLRADSLWTDQAAPRAMVSDRKAVRVGDILSVVVQESSVASKDTTTKTARNNAIDASIESFFYTPPSGLLTHKGVLPTLKAQSKQSFDGGGQVNNSEKIVARLAVTVVDVLPNGNLVVEGKRQTAFAGETQDVVLRGFVRPMDITANNTIFSYNIADATIRYVSKGTTSNSAKKGWFSKLWDKVSPF